MSITMTSRLNNHIAKRETSLGRWGPVAFYGLNVLLWFVTGIVFSAGHLLWLVILTVPALALYLVRLRWNRTSH